VLQACVVAQPIEVAIGSIGMSFTIPAMNADGWLIALTQERLVEAVIPGLLAPEDASELIAALMTGGVTQHDLVSAAQRAMAAASGRPWWETLRLVGYADQPGGELYGHLLLAGVHPERVTLAGWCVALYALIVRHKDDKERNQFEFDLKMPPSQDIEDVENWDTVVW
jgi:hypothetical protein